MENVEESSDVKQKKFKEKKKKIKEQEETFDEKFKAFYLKRFEA